MKQTIYYFAIIALLCVTSCQGPEPVEPVVPPVVMKFEVSNDSLVFSKLGTEDLKFDIKASGSWRITRAEGGEWCNLSDSIGTGSLTITVGVSAQTPMDGRSTELTVSDAHNNVVTVKVRQLSDTYFTLSTDTLRVNSLANKVLLKVSYNPSVYTAVPDCDWILVSQPSRVTEERVITVIANNSVSPDELAEPRVGRVVFKREGEDQQRVVVIEQSGFSERDILKTIHAALIGKPLSSSDVTASSANETQPWGDANVPIGQWSGVTADDQGSVLKLEFIGEEFSGAIPWEITFLTHLQSLRFVKTNLAGYLPSTFYNLKKLHTFEMSQNGKPLDKSALGILFKLPALEYLEMGSTVIEGTIPEAIGDCANLIRLSMRGCSLTGEIPAGLFLLPNLLDIDLGNNKLTGSLPTEVGQCESLRELFLYNNNLEGFIPEEICNLTKLEYFEISINRFIGSLPAHIGNMAALHSYGANDNLLTGSLPESVAGMSNLEYLWLANNYLSGEIPQSVREHVYFKEWISNKFPGPKMNLCTQKGAGFTNCGPLK